MGRKSKPQKRVLVDHVLPSAPSMSEYYATFDPEPSGGSAPYSPYAELSIPPPPNLPLPDLPPPPYPPRTPVPSSLSSSSNLSSTSRTLLVGEKAANFNVPFSKIKKRQANPQKSFNPLILTRRGCTDMICSFLLILFIIAWGFVAVLGFMWGQPERLIHPTDSLGRTCGYNRPGAYNLSGKPYLFFFDLTKCVSYVTVLTGCPTPQICVEKCPTEYFSYLQLQYVSSGSQFVSEVRKHVICQDSYDVETITNFQTLQSAVENQWCTAYTVKSAAVLGRCIPQIFIDAESVLANATTANSTLDQIISAVGNGNNMIPSDSKINDSTVVLDGVVNTRAVLQKIAADLSVSWYQILAFFAAAAVISFLWIVLMRLLGGFMIWLSIFMILGLLGGGAAYCWLRYYTLFKAGAINDYSFQPAFNLYFEMPTTWMVFGIILSALLLIIFVIFLFVRSRIKLAVAVIEETSRALGCMLSTLFFPLLPFILHLIVFGIFGSIAIWLASSGEENCRSPNPNNKTDIANGPQCDCNLLGTTAGADCHYVNLTRNGEILTYLQLFNLFGCFWMSCFVGALSDITLAGAFASYYWAFRKPKDVPSFPVIQSLGRAFRYHLGSLAFGSLLLAIVKIIRAILEFLYQKLHASQNKVAKAIFTILKCFFCCLEMFLRVLTKNAYIMIAMYGTSFFNSARESFSLIARNIIRTVVLNRVVGFLLFLGKATVTLGMGVVAFYWFSGKWIIDGLPQVTLYYYFVPVIIVVIGSYFICDLFFEVFEMGVDTIFLCFLEDSESNDGTESKPFYMSEQLKKIYGKKNQF